ncbi:bifunctional helix-turn-helix transcriptional regulator/GNAT family N-acetyltransferase [Nocardioides dongxiaopingii]|uniref:bifunctional helix-turn-helix transcriptional regulator/GNAT family N-acetyltransferase n=1 Tax=Nocardioides sp. S-1144 TaxID=2582905 RepID=UPI0021CAF9CF|nr:helix-turn-helix domain-containing GNAT family N-acetyltransferase [Nocardioides sp. S-1144]
MSTDLATATLRRFNRTYTQRIGVLEESFLGLGLPLGGARLLFEIGAPGAAVRDLRDRLGLDSGYLSRLLRDLEARGLAGTAPDPADRRRRHATLTDDGRALLARLETRSDELALRLVAPLTERQRGRLTEALATADLLVRAATVVLREVDPAGPAATESMGRYFAELAERFPDGFDPGTPSPLDCFTVATSDRVPVACGGLQRLPGDATRVVDEIKRMWVDPSWRGAGLGSRLLRHLEDVARGRAATTIRLDTNGTLSEAIAMYERGGYRSIGRYNDNPYAELFFEKDLS